MGHHMLIIYLILVGHMLKIYIILVGYHMLISVSTGLL